MVKTKSSFLLPVLALSLALNICAVWWGLPSFYGWAPDEINPRVIQEGLEVRFSGDWTQPNYPPFHYYLLGLLHLPVVALDALGFVDVSSLSTYTFLFYLHRFLSIFMSAVILFTIHRIGVEVSDKRAAVFSALIAGLAAPYVYYSKTANLEVPVTFWFVISLYFFIGMVKAGRLRDYLLFTITAVAAICTKDQAFAFYVLPVLFFIVSRYREQRREGKRSALARTLFDRRMVLSAALAVFAFFAFHNVIFNTRGFIHHMEGILWARGHYSQFEATPVGYLMMTLQTMKYAAFSMGWPFALNSLFGVLIALKEWRKRPLPLWILAFVASYYVFFVAPVLSNYVRYLVPICVVLALFGGRVLADLLDSRRRMVKARYGLAAVVLSYSIWYAASVDILMLNDSRYAVEQWLSDNVGPASVVGYMGPEYYLPRLHPYEARRLRPTETVLHRSSPDFLVINADFFERFVPGEREWDLFQRLQAGRTGYALVHSYLWPPKGVLINLDGILSNLEKINPHIEVYQRAE